MSTRKEDNAERRYLDSKSSNKYRRQNYREEKHYSRRDYRHHRRSFSSYRFEKYDSLRSLGGSSYYNDEKSHSARK